MDREEKERKTTNEMTSSREAILELVACGKIKEEDVDLTEKEKEIVEGYKKTNQIIKEKGINNLYWSTPID